MAPIKINPKIHPALSEVIMKALTSAPEERYQSGQELVNDLERCKESATKTGTKKSAQPAPGLNAPEAPKEIAAAAAGQPQQTRSVASPRRRPRNEVARPAPPVTLRECRQILLKAKQQLPRQDGKAAAASLSISQAPKATENRRKRPGKAPSRSAPAPWPRLRTSSASAAVQRGSLQWRKARKAGREVQAFPK